MLDGVLRQLTKEEEDTNGLMLEYQAKIKELKDLKDQIIKA